MYKYKVMGRLSIILDQKIWWIIGLTFVLMWVGIIKLILWMGCGQ